jgi:hypothetical protein
MKTTTSLKNILAILLSGRVAKLTSKSGRVAKLTSKSGRVAKLTSKSGRVAKLTSKSGRVAKRIETLLLLALALTLSKGFAQNFNYTITLDTAAQYTALSGATPLSTNTKWQPQYNIPTSFTADSATAVLTSITFETNGYFVYNKSLNHALMAFTGYTSVPDSNTTYSQLSYLTSGAPGNQVLKVQLTNLGKEGNPEEYLSYQLWLHQNGAFDIIIGDNTYNTASTLDTMQYVHIGLINRNMDQETNGLFVAGTPQSPVPAILNTQNTELAYLRTMPKKGYKYTFTPTQN